MSWLLVATVPTLLMLATIGLERIESGLDRAAAATGLGAEANGDANLRFRTPQGADRG